MKQDGNKRITRVSIVGIGTNAVIAAFKVLVGLLSNSVAVLLDAVNNVSDALSSAITTVGVKLAGRKPDSKHPFGYGRVEYFSAILIAGIIFAAGVSSMIESVKAIIHPEPTSFTWVSVMVIVVAIAGKVILGRYCRRMGLGRCLASLWTTRRLPSISWYPSTTTLPPSATGWRSRLLPNTRDARSISLPIPAIRARIP